MKILLINDYLICGGAEMQALREKELLEKNGHDVYSITFDNCFPENDLYYNENNGFYNINIDNINLKKILNSLGILKINNSLLKEIRRTIDYISPDIIHINNLMQDSFTQYKALEGYKVVQTIRDYVAVCPLNTCIKGNKVCTGYKYNNCYKECGHNIKEILKIKLNFERNKYRKSYIGKYICPSENLTNYCKKHDYNITCINNPFDFEKFYKLKKNVDFNKKIYLYYGAINKNKGVMNLIKAFKEFSLNKEVKLLIAGKIFDEVRYEFEQELKNDNNIEYLGILKYEQMINVLEIVHTIVVPSVWMENYPNTVLEGLATRTIVIGSNRGGIPSMLDGNRGIVFEIEESNALLKALEKSYDLSKEQYEEIVIRNVGYVKENNSLSKYYDRLIEEFNSVIEKE